MVSTLSHLLILKCECLCISKIQYIHLPGGLPLLTDCLLGKREEGHTGDHRNAGWSPSYFSRERPLEMHTGTASKPLEEHFSPSGFLGCPLRLSNESFPVMVLEFSYEMGANQLNRKTSVLHFRSFLWISLDTSTLKDNRMTGLWALTGRAIKCLAKG